LSALDFRLGASERCRANEDVEPVRKARRAFGNIEIVLGFARTVWNTEDESGDFIVEEVTRGADEMSFVFH
jgi:hypothetical protein